MLTAVVFDRLEGGVRTDAPIVVGYLIADINSGKTAAERDIDAILVHISGGAVTEMSDRADVAQVIEKNVIPALACLGVVEIERALFCIKIVLHNFCPFKWQNLFVILIISNFYAVFNGFIVKRVFFDVLLKNKWGGGDN